MTYQRRAFRHSHGEHTITPIMLGVGSGGGWGANEARGFYINLPTKVRIDKFGILPAEKVSGNYQVGLYRVSDWALMCATAATAVNTLTALTWNWIASTTTPVLDAGDYYLMVVCNTAFLTTVSGLDVYSYSTALVADIHDKASLNGNPQLCVNMAAAYPLPATFVPVNYDDAILYMLGLKVSYVS